MPIFDLCSGRLEDGSALWIEAVEGLKNATDRMKQFAVETQRRKTDGYGSD